MLPVLEFLLSFLPHCFVLFLSFHPSLWGSRSTTKQRREQSKGRRKLARSVSWPLFPENECNFHSFPWEAGPSQQQPPRCCRGE